MTKPVPDLASGTGFFMRIQLGKRLSSTHFVRRVDTFTIDDMPYGKAIAAAILVAILFSTSACGPPNKRGDTMPKRDINIVMEAHVSELMAIPGVAGVAVGALDDGTPCILVLVIKASDELGRKIPKTLEGHPVQIFESGEIKPMDGK